VSFTHFPCPSCQTVLRMAASMPENKTVRCPKCGECFRAPAVVEDDKKNLTTTEPRRTPPAPTPATEVDEALARKIRRSAPQPHTLRWMLLGLLGAGLFLLLLLGGVGTIVWRSYSSAKMARSPAPPPMGLPPQQQLPPQLGQMPPQGKPPLVWFVEGNDLYHQGDLDGAINAFTKAIEGDPKMAAAYTNRGLARSNKGDFDGGIADSTKAIELDASDPFPFINRANARIRKGVDPDASIADARHALKLRPNVPAALLNLGMARAQKGDFDGAIAEYDKALALLPTFEIAYVQRGQAWMQKEKWNKAEADFTRALELNVVRPDLYQNRGACRSKQGNREGAIADYTAGLQLDPRSLALYYQRGRAAFAGGDLKKAQADLDKALELQPKLLPLQMFQVKLLLCRGEDDGALAAAERLVTDQPKSAEALACRAGVRAWRGEDDKARADYAAALVLDPKSLMVYLMRGWFHLCADRAEEAARDADAGLKLGGPRDPQSPYFAILAHCARRQKQADAARRLVAESIDDNKPKHWPQPILRYLHDDMSAKELFRAADNDDQRTEARAYAGVVLWLSGATDKAREHLQWVRDHGNRDFVEYDLTELLLRRWERAGTEKP
jgi:predicted Zn finger-like uncharacterized protein